MALSATARPALAGDDYLKAIQEDTAGQAADIATIKADLSFGLATIVARLDTAIGLLEKIAGK